MSSDESLKFIESPELESNYRSLAAEISTSYFAKYKKTLENKDFLDAKYWERESQEGKIKHQMTSHIHRGKSHVRS